MYIVDNVNPRIQQKTSINGKQIQQLFRIFRISFLPGAKDHLTKTPITHMRPKPLLFCWSGLCKRLPKYNILLLLSSIAPQKWKVTLYCWRQCKLQTQAPEVHEMKLAKMFLPELTLILPEDTMQTSKMEKQPTLLPMMTSMNYNGHHGTTLRVHLWHVLLGMSPRAFLLD